tara:strand:+ start:16917 stop:17099 length:183 start_codon:yes stop_codon:yes gene_type:complete
MAGQANNSSRLLFGKVKNFKVLDIGSGGVPNPMSWGIKRSNAAESLFHWCWETGIGWQQI